jgi:hypothetical protein
MAQLLVDVLVIMPNHFHLLLTPAAEIPGDGIGRPATRAKALNLYTGTFSRV